MSKHDSGAEKPAKRPGRHREPEWPTVDPDAAPAKSAPLPKRDKPSRWFRPKS